MLYLLFGFVFSVFSFLEIIARNRNILKVIFCFFTLLMILIAGLRDGSIVGTDSPAYSYMYHIDIYPNVELAYKYLNGFFSSSGVPYNFFLLFINSIILFNYSKFIRENSYYLLLPLFIYFSDFYFYYNFSGIRQAIAMSFTALSVCYIFENKRKISFILIIIACLFHVTALIFLLAFFIPKVKMEVTRYLKFLVVIITSILLSGYIIESVPYLSSKFQYYSSVQEKSDNIVNEYYVGLVKRLIAAVAVILVYKNFFADNKNFYLYNLYLVGIIIYAVSYLLSPDFGVRLGSYFILLDCVLVARYIFAAKSLTNKLVLFAVFALIALYKIYTYTLISAYDYRFLGL